MTFEFKAALLYSMVLFSCHSNKNEEKVVNSNESPSSHLSPSSQPIAPVIAPQSSSNKIRSTDCSEGMVQVKGNYCPVVEQVCLEYHSEYKKDIHKMNVQGKNSDRPKSTVSDRCLVYQEPSKCLSKERKPLDFCMDEFEWPNRKGELPALLISWMDAKAQCERVGKRLCTEEEFNFACEGEDMLPYSYGYVRDASVCNIDKPYRKREKKLYKFDNCMKHAICKEHLAFLDQRVPAGSMEKCVSPFGVHDLNGNINEWVSIPGEKYPNRSGLKGGWWGPIRSRCRPTVTFHKEEDYGYEEGFRCCDDVENK